MPNKKYDQEAFHEEPLDPSSIFFTPPASIVSIKLSYSPPSALNHAEIVLRLRKLVEEVNALGCVCTITTIDADGVERRLDT